MKAFLLLSAVAAASAYMREDLIQAVNSDPSSTWKAEASPRFADMTFEQIKALMGTRINSSLANTRTHFGGKLRAGLPTNFDSRDKWPRCQSIKMIRDQGQCGSCWAFGAAESFSDRYCIASDQSQQNVFSPYALMTCSEGDFGCEGGYLHTAWEYIEKNGLPLDSCQPYKNVGTTTPPCKWGQCTGTGNWDTWKVSSTSDPGCGWFSCSPDEMADEIQKMGPIEGSFTVYEDFMNYKSGVYKRSTSSSNRQLGGHAIKIIGWGEENGTPYWLIANSWGTSWGLKGFFKILRGQNECGIESNNGAGVPVVKRSVSTLA